MRRGQVTLKTCDTVVIWQHFPFLYLSLPGLLVELMKMSAHSAVLSVTGVTWCCRSYSPGWKGQRTPVTAPSSSALLSPRALRRHQLGIAAGAKALVAAPHHTHWTPPITHAPPPKPTQASFSFPPRAELPADHGEELVFHVWFVTPEVSVWMSSHRCGRGNSEKQALCPWARVLCTGMNSAEKCLEKAKPHRFRRRHIRGRAHLIVVL